MNKKIILMLVAMLGMSPLVQASENPPTPPATFLSKVIAFLGTTANYTLNWPTLLLQKISPARFDGLSTFKSVAFDSVVYAMIAVLAKVGYDKYQKRQRETKEQKVIQAILEKFENAQEDDEEEIKTEEDQPVAN